MADGTARAASAELWVIRLGAVPYREALALQEAVRTRRQADELPDLLLLLEGDLAIAVDQCGDDGEGLAGDLDRALERAADGLVDVVGAAGLPHGHTFGRDEVVLERVLVFLQGCSGLIPLSSVPNWRRCRRSIFRESNAAWARCAD